MENKSLTKKIIPLAGLAFIISLFYLKLLNGFFQQDEWYSFGYFLLNRNLNFQELLKFVFAPNITHYNPITVLIEYILFSSWGMDYSKFMLLGIILHIITVFSLYVLANKIFKDNLLSFLTALLFGVFASIYQGAGWVIVDIATTLSTILCINAARYFLDYLESKKNKYIIYSCILISVSLFVKEIGIGLFPLFLIVIFFYGTKKKKIKNILILLMVFIFYLILRVIMTIFSPHAGGELVTESQSIRNLIYNFFTVPLRSITQIFFPSEFIHSVASNITHLIPSNIRGDTNSPAFDEFVLKRVMEAISVVGGIIVYLICILLIFIKRKARFNFLVLFSLGWVILNSFIISFSPGRSEIIFAVDSRNLYFLSIGVAILVITMFKFLNVKKNKIKIILLFLFFLFNFFYLNKNLENFTSIGNIRKNILYKIQSDYPKLPQETVFYTESDSSFYGLPESTKILPFQSGFGQTLLAYYAIKNNFPKEFFRDNFLWNIDSQGYKKVGSVGFGYFWKFEDLTKFYASNKDKNIKLIAYKYSSKENILSNITEEIQRKIDSLKSKVKSRKL